MPGKHKSKVPTHFTPQFWTTLNGNSGFVRTIKRRLTKLRQDAAVESMQQDMLAQRAVFICAQLETMEVQAAQGEEFNLGRYTQMVNTLIGLLKSLGLEKQIPKAIDLKAYVKGERST